MNTIDIPVVKGGSSLPYELPPTLTVWDKGERPKGHIFRILNSKDGDKRVVWNSLSLAEIQDAKRMFDDLVAKGLVPYRVDESARRTPEVMSVFDPAAEEILFAPIQLAAGG
jgi:hypothetical protein